MAEIVIIVLFLMIVIGCCINYNAKLKIGTNLIVVGLVGVMLVGWFTSGKKE